jgi:hypothetical protein
VGLHLVLGFTQLKEDMVLVFLGITFFCASLEIQKKRDEKRVVREGREGVVGELPFKDFSTVCNQRSYSESYIDARTVRIE